MKRKAIHAELRKESQTFEGWLKYEVTIQNPDGSVEKVPAYGRDLQDALSRVVHDEKVEKIQKTANKIPTFVWIVLWFGYITGLWQWTVTLPREWAAITFILGLAGITFTVGYISNWFRKRNKAK